MAETFRMTDEYYQQVGNDLKKYANELDKSYDKYIKTMERIGKYAITEGKMSDNIKKYTEYARKSKDMYDDIGKVGNTMCNNFIKATKEKSKFTFYS